jgi:hypothetical protein
LVKIHSENDYRQYLQRRKAIQDNINRLREEKTALDREIFDYVDTDQWREDRGLCDADENMITSLITLELTNCISAGGPAAEEMKMREKQRSENESSRS